MLDRRNRRGITSDYTLLVGQSPFADAQCLLLADALAPHLAERLHQLLRLPCEGILLAGQGHDDGDTWVDAGIAVERHQEGSQLLRAARPGALQAGGVLRQLVEHDEDLAASEHLLDLRFARVLAGFADGRAS